MIRREAVVDSYGGADAVCQQLADTGSMPEQPRVWALLGNKQGDNHQVLGLAEALNMPVESVRLDHEPYEPFTTLLLRMRISARKSKDHTLPLPWPDLVITSGYTNELVAKWIQASAKSAGQKVRIVYLGRPWNHPEQFDLVFTTPQYDLPALPHIIDNQLPLHRLSEEKLAVARESWRDTLGNLPGPVYTLLLGGNVGPYYRLRPGSLRLLVQMVNDMAASAGGSLCVTTSARTPLFAEEILNELVNVPHHKFLWHKDDPSKNPYVGYLAYGDEFIVTQDSISMLSEACFTGRPVHIFDVTGLRDEPIRDPSDGFFDKPLTWRVALFFYRLAMWMLPKRLERDVYAIQDRLIAEGRAVWLGEGSVSHDHPPINDVERTAGVVHSLLDKIKTEKVPKLSGVRYRKFRPGCQNRRIFQ